MRHSSILATKEDVANVRTEMATYRVEMRADNASLRGDMTTANANLRSELKDAIATVDKNAESLRAEMQHHEVDDGHRGRGRAGSTAGTLLHIVSSVEINTKNSQELRSRFAHYFINTVFSYSTLAESYKTTVFDGVNRLIWLLPPIPQPLPPQGGKGCR